MVFLLSFCHRCTMPTLNQFDYILRSEMVFSCVCCSFSFSILAMRNVKSLLVCSLYLLQSVRGLLTQWLFQMEEFFWGERILNMKPAYYRTLEELALWFSPELVWEIRGAGKSCPWACFDGSFHIFSHILTNFSCMHVQIITFQIS